MKASDVMTQPVITVHRDAFLYDAIQLMLKNRISGLPVVDNAGKPVGMLTEGDLLRRSETHTERVRPRWIAFLLGSGRLAEEYVHSHSKRINEVMSTKVISVSPDASLEQVVTVMERHRIKHVPVLKGEQIAGIITRANLMQALLHFSGSFPAPSQGDSEIQRRVLDELKTTSWGGKGYITVVVKDGTVHLHGIVLDARERDALRVAAENVPGVKAVHNHVEWCDMTSGTVLPFAEDSPVTPPSPRS